GTADRQVGTVGQDGTTLVRREELDVPVADHARRDDCRARGGRDRVGRVIAQLDAYRTPFRYHPVHRADAHPEDAHVGSLMDADRAGEVRDERMRGYP